MAAALKGHKISVCGADSCVDLFIIIQLCVTLRGQINSAATQFISYKVPASRDLFGCPKQNCILRLCMRYHYVTLCNVMSSFVMHVILYKCSSACV